MLSSLAFLALALVGSGMARHTGKRHHAADPEKVAAAAATAVTKSPVTHVRGKAFDRVMFVFLENTDYSAAAADPSLAGLATRGLTLTNYFGVTHPSMPNYVASHGGDNFGLNHDKFTAIDKKVATIVDLLEDKGISWGEYQEDMPYTGFTGDFPNQESGRNDYVRKHNPAVLYEGNNTPERLSLIKNMTQFHSDLENEKLPQWMFVTPNMTSDGHDSSITHAGKWARSFLVPLLNNPKFMKKTLVLLTFDESHDYTIPNRVFSILLGDAVPKKLVGETDATFYNHYSQLATVEANWGLHTLGRWDVGANVFDFVAKKTGDKNSPFEAITSKQPTRFMNGSFAGPLSNSKETNYPPPNLKLVRNRRTVLPAIAKAWADSEGTYYKNSVVVPDAQNPPAGYELDD